MAASSPEARFSFVWQPVIPSDDAAAALAHARAETDARARHYWDTDLALGRAYAEPLATPFTSDAPGGKPLAWDVVLVFAPGTRWGETPPLPQAHLFPMESGKGAPAFSPARLREAIERSAK